jgi:phosphate transport system protein
VRDLYHEQLDGINVQMITMSGLVTEAITRANRALLYGDLEIAESVIAADAQVDALLHSLEQGSFDVLARQQPVATDLRTIVASLRISATLERMGDLARHIAQSARRRFPESAVPDELRPIITEMAGVAEAMSAKLGHVLTSRDIERALELEADDDRMDVLHRQLFTFLLSDDWKAGVEPAIDVTLISRYHERFADHAVSASLRVVQLVTGQPYEELAASI